MTRTRKHIKVAASRATCHGTTCRSIARSVIAALVPNDGLVAPAIGGIALKAILLALAAAFVLASNGSAHAQKYPTKPVRYVCPFPVGGDFDIVTRIVATKLGEMWGQQVIVDNRPGAGGTLGADVAAKATPDGYTLLMGGAGPLAIAPALYKKLPYDNIRDFAPIALIGTIPMVLVVHPSAPAKSVSEFVAYAKANPGKVNYASAGAGSILHLSMEMFRSQAGVIIVHVPYKGAAPALVDLLGGQVLAMFAGLPLLRPHINAGKLRALGVASPKRSSQLPNVPTITEAGVPGYEVMFWFAGLAPAVTPRPILVRVHTDLVKALGAPDVRRRLEEQGIDIIGSTRDELGAFIRAETIKWAKAVKDSGATAD